MKSHYSILKYVNNPLSNESIALGLLVVSNKNVFFHISPQKLELAKRLNNKNYKLLEFTVNQFRKFVVKDSITDEACLIERPKELSTELLSRLSIYNNGILQFSKPEIVDSEISKDSFNDYVSKFIGEEIAKTTKVNISIFKEKIKSKLYDPLKDRIDVNYTLKKKQLDSLFFDFHLDGIGVNGALYAAKAIDLNSNRQLGQIRSDISEFESVIERLNRFAETKGLSKDHQYCLIVDPYKGTGPSYNDLYSLLKNDKMPLFKIISSDKVDDFVTKVIKNKARKFSEEILID